ncbi:MAG: serine hydrolase domain-containing protein [Saprospiraceae bacterium]
MKKLLFLALLLPFTRCQRDMYVMDVQPLEVPVTSNPRHPLKDSLDAIVARHIRDGVPGIQVMVKDADGWYVTSQGFAQVEGKVPFRDNMVAWVYSITKVFTATLTLMSAEEGRVDLDRTIDAYLPVNLIGKLANYHRITVRQLLNHSSGLRNFTVMPAYQLAQLNQPFKQPDLMEQLAYVYGKPAMFEPGTDFYYSNTNYLLLQKILERVNGTDYRTLLQTKIVEPLQLKHLYYIPDNAQWQALGFPNYYFERHADGQLENVTAWHNAIGQSLEGYGGIAANGQDIIRFYEALLEGQLIASTSLEQMKTWITGQASTEPDYGLGLEYFTFGDPKIPTFGHEGDNLGGTTMVLYIPEKRRYLFISENAGRQLFGEYLFKTSETKIELCNFLARVN